ncbi:MAG: YfcE family phosphodiesterase [Bacillota bacterium]
MKALIISDSHGVRKTLLKVINSENPDRVFFLGDYISDAKFIKKNTKVKIDCVKGNLDYDEQGNNDLVLNFLNKRVFLTHGHKYNVKRNFYKLFLRAKELEVDYVFFGHTHKYKQFQKDNITFINPGSISKPRGQRNGSYVIINYKENKFNFLKKELTI